MKVYRVAVMAVLMAWALAGCDRTTDKSQAKTDASPTAADKPQGSGGGSATQPSTQTAYGPNSSATPIPHSPTDAGTTPGVKKGTIGVSVMTLSNPFFKIIGDTITSEGRKNGYEVIVVSGEDANKQYSQVKDFIVHGCVAIVLCPVDSKAIGAAIKEANAANIPVFTADLGTLDPDAVVVSHIATDNLEGGKQAGVAMIEALGSAGGKVLILDHKPAESCLLRVQGFKMVIDTYNATHPDSKIEVVAELPCGGNQEAGYKSTEGTLQAHPDLSAIFAINDPAALGARAALERGNVADRVKIIGFDGMPEGKKAIKEGKIFADPVQYPDKIATMTVDAIVKYFDGDRVPKVQLIPTGLYRHADGVNDPSLK